MANSWFEFKQFKILQEKAAMKVGTDGVLLGAWVELPDLGTALDVGTGTGLITLMMAQRNSLLDILGLEIDEDASVEAIQNITLSPWRNRINVNHISFQDFLSCNTAKFDLIVSNPPFFTTSVKAPREQRSVARHADVLPSEIILKGAKQLLVQDGTIAVILPVIEFNEYAVMAKEMGFIEYRRLTVFPTLNKPAVRVLSQWGLKKKKDMEMRELVIEPISRHQYSPEYIALTRDFYVKM